MLKVEQLEARDCPAPLALVGGNLLYNAPDRGGSLVVDSRPDGGLSVTYDGRAAGFAPGAVTQIIANGGRGDDVLVNNTSTPSVLSGGAGDDFLSGGIGNDVLLGGKGQDLVYDIVGTNFHDGGAGKDTLIVSGRDSVIPDGRDIVAVFQTRPPVQLVDGVLYLTGNERSFVTKVGNRLFVDVFSSSSGPSRYEFAASQVKFIAGLGTAGNDLFINGSDIDSVYYGIGGNDVLVGGRGSDLFKGGSGDDILAGGGGGRDILFGNAGADALFGGSLVFRDANDVFFRGVR